MINYEEGDYVVYCKSKCSNQPGPRAKNITPSSKGELSYYQVDKFWKVCKIDGEFIYLITRCGKIRKTKIDNHKLRKATVLERVIYSKKYNFDHCGTVPENCEQIES